MDKVKEGGRQIAAGGCAGLVEVSLMHPLDLMKTRLQIGGGHFTGLADCFRKTLQKEGALGFYKGILPPILAETPKRATKFFTFEQYKKASEQFSTFLPLWSRLSLAGLCSGLTEAFVICPFEVIKVRLQSEHNVTIQEQKSTATIAREIIRTKGLGLNGLYLGLGPTLYRHGVWNMIYFGLYHNMRNFISATTAPIQNQYGDVAMRLLLGFTAGTLASIANIPFDVAKSRVQGPQPSTGRIYHSTWQTVFLVKKQEGFKTLYRGLVPKVMRLGPGGGIMLVVYETVYDFLQRHT
ncbi:mitochondrial carrier protein [Ditylenchus destructor]|nr:mitochondrial carrier protein [Ditylenchus destructor]